MGNSDLSFPNDFDVIPIESGSYFTPKRNSIPSPPDDLPFHYTYPPEEWRFSDQARPDFEDDILEREPFESGEADQKLVLREEERRRIREFLQEDEEVHEWLSGQRHTFIGTSLRNSPSKDEDSSPHIEVLAYDYDRDTALIFRLEYSDEMTVESVEETDFLPTPTTSEAEKAIELALNSEQLANTGVEEMEAGVLRDYSHITSTSGDTGTDNLQEEDIRNIRRLLDDINLPSRITSPLNNHLGMDVGNEEREKGRRRLDVRFRMTGERAPRFYALVDLTNEKILEAGSVE